MVGRDLAVNGNFSFRLSGKKHAAFQRMDLPTLFVFSPWLLCFKKVKGSVCVGGAWGGAVCLEGSKQKGKRVGNDCYQPKVLLWLAAALFMKRHNNSELTPVCSYQARFLGARWALCDCMSVDYFISYIWDSKWPPRMPQERDTASQLGDPTFTRTPSGAEGRKPAIPK